MSLAIAGILSSVGTVALGLLTWFGGKALRRASVRKVGAETRQINAEAAQTEAESWGLLTGGWKDRVAALEAENVVLRDRLAASEVRAELAEALARQCRLDLDDLQRRYEATAAPGGGLMRPDPDDLTGPTDV